MILYVVQEITTDDKGHSFPDRIIGVFSTEIRATQASKDYGFCKVTILELNVTQ